jgi:hypothetical protein
MHGVNRVGRWSCGKIVRLLMRFMPAGPYLSHCFALQLKLGQVKERTSLLLVTTCTFCFLYPYLQITEFSCANHLATQITLSHDEYTQEERLIQHKIHFLFFLGSKIKWPARKKKDL